MVYRILLAMLILTAQLSAQTLLPDQNCKYFESDPYELGARIKEGPFKGQCIKSDEKRNLTVLENYRDKVVIANFRHEDKFWIAHIPIAENIIDRTIFIEERFAPEWIAAHTESRFDFKPGHSIKLLGQNETNRGEVRYVNSVVLSWEANRIVGGTRYTLIKAMQKKFAITAQALSFEQVYNIAVRDFDHKTFQYELSFNEKEKRDLFLYMLFRAASNHKQNQVYHTLKNNCLTNIYDSYDLIRKLPTKRKNFLKFLPVAAKKELRRRKIFSKELPSVKEEFEQR